jgi:hypothetical protein
VNIGQVDTKMERGMNTRGEDSDGTIAKHIELSFDSTHEIHCFLHRPG